jgi:hypothetical protein
MQYDFHYFFSFNTKLTTKKHHHTKQTTNKQQHTNKKENQPHFVKKH